MAALEIYKKDFPLLQRTLHGKPLIYLDTGATAQKPNTVIDAMSDFYRHHYATVHRAIYDLALHSTDMYNAARSKVQNFLNAKHLEEVIFTRGTTESINMVAYSFGKAFLRPGDEIIISAMEHHSNIVPWQLACEDRGARLRVIPIDENGELQIDAYAEMLSPRTKIVSIAHIANSIGTINPISEISAMAHSHGAAVLVDGAQAAPHMAIDVQALDVDFYLFSGHKLYGPTGIGILYGKKEWLEKMPPYQGGGDMIEKVTFEMTSYDALPLKFEAGTPMIVEAIGLAAAIDYLTAIGMKKIWEWEQQLLEYATKAIEAVDGVKIIGRAARKGAIISFTADNIHPLDLGTMMNLRGIALRTGHHCAQPTLRHFGLDSMARISFGLYNSISDIDTFVTALSKIIPLLQPVR